MPSSGVGPRAEHSTTARMQKKAKTSISKGNSDELILKYSHWKGLHQCQGLITHSQHQTARGSPCTQTLLLSSQMQQGFGISQGGFNAVFYLTSNQSVAVPAGAGRTTLPAYLTSLFSSLVPCKLKTKQKVGGGRKKNKTPKPNPTAEV